MTHLGTEALARFMDEDFGRVLDLGSGAGDQAKILRQKFKVDTISLFPPADIIGDYLQTELEPYDGIWCCHVLEHQPNVNFFLRKLYQDLTDDGVLAITVPPRKDQVVGGHLNLFNAGTLVYNLIMAGFNCSKARVAMYGYNVSVIVQKRPTGKVPLTMDSGDIERLAQFFPFPVEQGFDGLNARANW